MRKPFYKASHKAWLILDTRKGSATEGKQITLAKGGTRETEPEAMAAWAAMRGAEQPAAPQAATGFTLAGLVERWLAWVGRHRSSETLRSYRHYANEWARVHGNLPAATIRGYHVTELCEEAFAVSGLKRSKPRLRNGRRGLFVSCREAVEWSWATRLLARRDTLSLDRIPPKPDG